MDYTMSIPKNYWITSSSKTNRQEYTHSITPLPNFCGDEQDKEIILTYVETP